MSADCAVTESSKAQMTITFHNNMNSLQYGAAVGVGLLVTAWAQAASLTGLGFLPGGDASWARAVSADGSVVVGESEIPTSTNAVMQAFRWTEGGGMEGLGMLPGGKDSGAKAVSSDGGTVVGFSSILAGDPPALTEWYGFRWTQAGGMSPVDFGFPRGVSGDGSVVVGDRSFTNEPSQACRWTADGAIGLGVLHGGVSSSAMGVSHDSLSVVGTSFTDLTPGGEQAFLWTPATGMVGLAGLPGSSFTEGNGISADGTTVVGVCAGPDVSQGFRWTAKEGMTGLGTLPDGGNTAALAASGDGRIVVGFANTRLPAEAIVWDITHGIRNLQRLLIEQHADLTGWQLDTALAISSDGHTIVGSGYHNGTTEAWVARVGDLTRPELSVAIGGGGLKLSWPGTAIVCQLQSSPTPSGPWTNVSIPPVVAGNSQSVILPAADTAGFFHLLF